MRAWAASEVAESGSKVIIAVPSQSLAIEFEDQKENSRRWQAGNKKIPEFEIIQPLYDPEYCNSITRRIETLRHFLKSDASGVMVACYQTVVGAFHRLPKKHFSNMCLIVDEAHHSVIMDNDSVFESDLNSLGSVIQKCYQNNVVLRFLTATFFRDDRRGVISDSIMEEAVTYDMKLHDFLSDKQLCPQIKRIACDVRFSKSDSSKYQGGYYHSVKGIWEEDPSQKTAIWISNSSKYDKVRLTEEAIRALGTPIVSEATLLKYGIPQEELDEAYGSFIYVKDSFGNIHRVVELAIQDGDEYSDNLWKWYRGCVVTRTDRETVFNKYKESIISACVYLNKGQEGTNWKKLSRAIIYDQRKLGKSTQIIGRILRPSPKKSDVTIHYVLPQILCKTLNEDTKEIINNYINCLWASMIIGDYLEPLLVRAKREGYSSNSRLVRDQTEYSKVFAIDKEAERIYIKNCSERLDQWNEGLEYKPSNSETKEKLSEIVADEVSFGGLDVENHEKFVDATWQKLVMIKLNLGRTNPRKIEYNMIMNEDTPIGCSKAFYGTVMTKEFALEYKQFLDKLLGVSTKSLEEVKEYILSHSEITGKTTWFDHWESNKPEGIMKEPWKTFKMTQKDFWDYVFTRSEPLVYKSLDEHIIRAKQLKAKGANHLGPWKQRGRGYYAVPERHFDDFWSKLYFDEDTHIKKAIKLKATGSQTKAWKNLKGWYYKRPENHFDGFWIKVNKILGKYSRGFPKNSEEDHINRAIELGATSTGHPSWKQRGISYYASPEKQFNNFWKKVKKQKNVHH
jgi:hypothetical protein